MKTPDPPARSPIQGKTSPTRILVVEDDFINQQVAEAMVNGLGYECVLAANGLDALNCLTQGDFAAVLMDCQMPVLDGYEASAQIRALEGEVRHTPIIAMTANAREGDRERCLAAEMDDYIAKPVRSALLGEMLERWVTPMVRRRDRGSGQKVC